jgi:hypothetical protein
MPKDEKNRILDLLEAGGARTALSISINRLFKGIKS